MNYTQYIQGLAAAIEAPLNVTINDTPFVAAAYNSWLPRAIEYAEQRIYRELDMLGTRAVDDSATLTANNRRVTLPSSIGTFIVVEQVNVFSPSGTRNQLLPVSKEFIDFCWPTDVPAFTPSVPQFWCPFDQATIFVGPSPDTGYSIEVTGTIRPTPLSSLNPTTIITTYLSDLFMAASMISWAGFQRDYGAQADDPQNALSWEQEYQKAFTSAQTEQFRIRFQAQGWGCRQPSPIAQPPQT